VPSSCLTTSRPLLTTPTWRAWQLSVPATGFTQSDQRHPGSNAKRAAVVAPKRTTSTRVLSGVRVSSGESKSRDSTPATAVSSRRSTRQSSLLWRPQCKRSKRVDQTETPNRIRRSSVAGNDQGKSGWRERRQRAKRAKEER